jgi:hypothetical protein
MRPFALLNGTWDFDFDPGNVGLQENWVASHNYSRKIRVPFPWQSELSGIYDVKYQGAAWYQREISVPASVKSRRVFLIFGAVDWQATVWIDGKQVAEHEGGYAPFEVELTDVLKPGKPARLTVRAYDVTDPETPTGKQTGWYTPSGGIWQSVYLEYRGESYVKHAHITPDIDNSRVEFDCRIETPAAGTYNVAVHAIEGPHRFSMKQNVACKAGVNEVRMVLPIDSPALWSPDSPTLYDARIVLSRADDVEDWVNTYFGMRKISRGTYGGSSQEYILLNNKPIFLRGALHQSFNPKGIYTHPDDAFIRNDYTKAKEFGLNFIRIHIKVDEPRALYWADHLGIMLMCDMPNFTKNTARAHTLWEQTLRAAIDRDFNHPSIIAWCNFNETWGIGDGGYTPETQQWVQNMYLLARQLDPARLVEDNSACSYDHVQTDVNSWHFYIDNYGAAAAHVNKVVQSTFPGSEFNYVKGRKQDTAPLINSEYGGVSAGGGDRDISWVFLFLTNLLRKHDKICGYVYTELEDIEWEHNGFMNYDRSPKEYNYPAGITLADLQNEEFPVLDCPPYQRVDPFAHVAVPILVSHWSERAGLKLRVSAFGTTVNGTPWSAWFKPVERDIDVKPFTVGQQGSFDVNMPGVTGVLTVLAEILQDGKRIAANYCVIDARGEAWFKPDEYAASFPVNAFSACNFPAGSSSHSTVHSVHSVHPSDQPVSGSIAPKPGKAFGLKSGFFEYRIKLPMRLKPDKIAGCKLVAEVASKASTERLDWPARTNPLDYPQTDGKLWPTDITISLNGIPFHQVTINNDFADALGILSHVANYQHGSRGEVLDIPITDKALDALNAALNGNRVVTLRFEVRPDAQHVGGIALYGADMGAYPSDPALVFSLAPGARKPTREAKVLKVR